MEMKDLPTGFIVEGDFLLSARASLFSLLQLPDVKKRNLSIQRIWNYVAEEKAHRNVPKKSRSGRTRKYI